MGNPAEDSSLSLDHLQTGFLKLWEIRSDAVGGDQAIESSIIGFTNGGVDANLGGHSGDDELLNVQVLQQGMQVGGKEGTFARLVDDGFASGGI